jgi:hypothetical protein
VKIVLLALVAFVAACTVGGPSATDSALCTCSSDQKYDGTTKTCVAAASWTAPANCTDNGSPVCGCDNANYTSECKAYAVGVEVAYGGSCQAGGTSGGGGLGGFGW